MFNQNKCIYSWGLAVFSIESILFVRWPVCQSFLCTMQRIHHHNKPLGFELNIGFRWTLRPHSTGWQRIWMRRWKWMSVDLACWGLLGFLDVRCVFYAWLATNIHKGEHTHAHSLRHCIVLYIVWKEVRDGGTARVWEGGFGGVCQCISQRMSPSLTILPRTTVFV